MPIFAVHADDHMRFLPYSTPEEAADFRRIHEEAAELRLARDSGEIVVQGGIIEHLEWDEAAIVQGIINRLEEEKGGPAVVEILFRGRESELSGA